jgi:hypothetical protein
MKTLLIILQPPAASAVRARQYSIDWHNIGGGGLFQKPAAALAFENGSWRFPAKLIE